jgi:YD repeat-containing protein
VLALRSPSDRRARAGGRVREVALPNGATRYDCYDLLDRLSRQEFPDGTWLRYRYDGRRLARIAHSDGEHVAFDDDPAARALVATRGGIRTELRSDDAGLPQSVTLTIDGFTWTTEYAYDVAGRTTAIRYPGASAWTTAGTRLATGERVYVDVERLDDDRSVARFANGVTVHETLADGRIAHLCVRDVAQRSALDVAYAYDEQGRIVRAGDANADYDEQGRLRAWTSPRGARRYGAPELDPNPVVRRGARTYAYDALGRRSEEREGGARRRYAFDMFGALCRAELEDGSAIAYRYDGFGRLVARDTPHGTTYYLPDLDGRRLAEADAAGRIVRSYLWLGQACAAVLDGAPGGALALSLHHAHAGTVAAVGDRDGRVRLRACDDPFGAEHPVEDGVPGYGGLFGEPATGLLFATSRWLDPRTAQFVTPDAWTGVDPLDAVPGALRAAAREVPGGPRRAIDAASAYAWCDSDPVNRTDPYGHHWANFFWTIPSAVFWESQLTSISLQMYALNIVATVLMTFPGFGFLWPGGKDSFYRKTFAFDIAAPTASPRFGSFALVLNGLLTYNGGRNWTLGNVIWARGSEWRDIETRSKRDIVIAPNASAQLFAATKERVADRTRVQNDAVALSGTIAAPAGGAASPVGGGQITGAAVTAPAGAAPADVLAPDDWVSVSAGAVEERRRVVNAGATIDLDGPALPATLTGAVTLKRLDVAVAKVRGTAVAPVGREITFVRGDAIHVAMQLPERFTGPDAGQLGVTEYLPAGNRAPLRLTAALMPPEFPLLRSDPDKDWTGYAVANVVKIAHGNDVFAVAITALNGTHELVIDPPLPPVALPARYDDCVVARCDAVTNVAAQALAGGPTMLGAGDVATGAKTLKPGDVLEATVAPAPAPPALAVERRIVTAVAVTVPVAAINANALINVELALDQLTAGTAVNGAMSGAAATTIVTTDPTKTGSFQAAKPVAVTNTATGHVGWGIVQSVDAATHTIVLVEALDPAADFPDAAAVTIAPLTAGRRWNVDNLTAVGATSLVVGVRPAETPETAPRAADVLWLHLKINATGGVVRKPTAEPSIRATLNSALPPTHAANLALRQLRPVDATRRTGVKAPLMYRKLTGLAAADFAKYPLNDVLAIADSNAHALATQKFLDAGFTLPAFTVQAVVKVAAVDATSGTLTFDTMVEGADIRAPGTVQRVIATGVDIAGNAGAPVTLDEARVLVPDDPSVQLTRRKALEEHELRHAWQGAAWGPMFISLPIPWLVRAGAAIFNRSAAASNVTRWMKLGGLDQIIMEVVWPFVRLGQHAQAGITNVKATVGADKKSLVLDPATSADDVGKFVVGTRISVFKGAAEGLNIVDALDAASRTLTLRGPLEGEFDAADAVDVVWDPMDDVRRKVGLYTSLDFTQLWQDKIPPGWWQMLLAPLKRESWLPFLGLYFLPMILTKGDDRRNPVEQDASFHSGDVYTSIARSTPREISTGEFTRVFGFYLAREAGIAGEGGVSLFNGGLGNLAVELPAAITTGVVRGADRLVVEVTQSDAATALEVKKGDIASRFFAAQRVRVEPTGGGAGTVTALERVDGDAKKLFLVDPLLAAMGDGTNVKVTLVADEADVPDAVGDLRTVSGTVAGDTVTGAFATVGEKGAYVRVLQRGTPRDQAEVAEILDPAGVQFTRPLTTPNGTAVDVLASRVAFRENRRIKLAPLVENAVAFIFRAKGPGVYKIKILEGAQDDVLWHIGFSENLLELAQIVVKPVELRGDHPGPYYETERVSFTVDPSRWRVALAAGDRGRMAGAAYVAPKLNAGETSYVAKFDVSVHYDPNDPFFKKANRPEQSEDITLEAAEVDMVCQQATVRFLQLAGTVTTPPAVRAGGTSVFKAPLKPSDSDVRPARPPGAAADGYVTFDNARPTNVTYHAPFKVAPATDVTIDLYFGEGATRADKQKVTVTVHVTP